MGEMDPLLQSLIYTAQRAGGAIMAVYATDFAVHDKPDASPVTAADEAAEKIILAELERLAPEIPVVAEESVAAGRVPVIAERFFLVDPLDGTREFVSRRDEFTVNVALTEPASPSVTVASPMDTVGRAVAAGCQLGSSSWAGTSPKSRVTPLPCASVICSSLNLRFLRRARSTRSKSGDGLKSLVILSEESSTQRHSFNALAVYKLCLCVSVVNSSFRHGALRDFREAAEVVVGRARAFR